MPSRQLAPLPLVVATLVAFWSTLVLKAQNKPEIPRVIHPTVEFAAGLIRQGQIDDAVASLRPRIDADPEDCKAIGLMVVAYLQQRDMARSRSWLDRLRSVTKCHPTADAASKISTEIEQRMELARAVGAAIAQGDLAKIEEEIRRAEQTSGPLLSVRAYLDALKGEFPLLEKATDAAGIAASPALIEALRDRQRKLSKADEDLWFGLRDEKLVIGLAFANRNYTTGTVVESEGYGIAARLLKASNAGGQGALGSGKELAAFFARLVRDRYNLAPLNEGALDDLMTLAFVSGSPDQIESVARAMKTAVGRISWWGVFQNGNGREVYGQAKFDLRAGTLSYEPILIQGKGISPLLSPYSQNPVPRLNNHFSEKKWAIPLRSIRELSQSGTKFATIKAGYRSIDRESSGVVINGTMHLPLPGWFAIYVGLAYGEIPARQVAREYGAQVAQLLELPADKVKLIDERPGRGFSFQQLVGAVQGATQGTPNTMDFISRLSTGIVQIAKEREGQLQADSDAIALWQRAKTDPLLGQALDVGSVTEQVEKLLVAR